MVNQVTVLCQAGSASRSGYCTEGITSRLAGRKGYQGSYQGAVRMGRGFMKGGLPAYGRIDVPDFTKCVVG